MLQKGIVNRFFKNHTECVSRNSLTNLLSDSTVFVAFDTETTGLWAPTNHILEICAVRFTLASPTLESFQELVNPQGHIPKEVIPIHGITDGMVADARTAQEVLPDFVTFCGTASVLIAHNAPFDMSFLSCEFGRAGLPLPPNPILDTVTLCQRVFPGLQSYSLESLSKQFLQIPSQMHRALADADLVRQLFRTCAEKIISGSSGAGLIAALPVLYLQPWQAESVSLPNHYSDIATAIAGHVCLEIEYHAQGKTPHTRTVLPHRIYSQRGILYLVAHCQLAGEERTFRLDRITSFRMVSAEQ